MKKYIACLLVLCALGCVKTTTGTEKPATTTKTSPKEVVQSIKFCDLFGHSDKQDQMVLKGRFEGCPIWVESAAALNQTKYQGSVPQAQVNKISEDLEKQAQTEVKLAYIAQRTGFLDQPDIQKKLIRLVGNLYMREKKLVQNISEDEKQAYYQAHKEEFGYPTVRYARHILFEVNDQHNSKQAKAQAQAFYKTHGNKKMASGEFASLAATLSTDTETSWQGGLLPATASKGKYVTVEPALAETLFDLERGQISRPVKSSKGWHILYFARAVKGYPSEYKDVANLIHMKLQKKKYNDFIDFQLKSLGTTRGVK